MKFILLRYANCYVALRWIPSRCNAVEIRLEAWRVYRGLRLTCSGQPYWPGSVRGCHHLNDVILVRAAGGNLMMTTWGWSLSTNGSRMRRTFQEMPLFVV